ncbi:hypothetical protein ACIGBL_30735 [Streptomyces sp. NPDC085614]|uniref:hypothetical protein n=1 Tax=unclassified Streptomyces TaxID=2593676 RepID=UPI00164F4873|nr:hypothetical protein [Streptomyces sp. ms191]
MEGVVPSGGHEDVGTATVPAYEPTAADRPVVAATLGGWAAGAAVPVGRSGLP